MGMGHLKIRKSLKRDTIWIQKGAVKHKHNYSIHYIMEQHSPSGRVEYYNVMKCDNCDSFESIRKEGNISGHILNNLTKEEKSLPRIVTLKKHEYLIGFDDIEKILKVDRI